MNVALDLGTSEFRTLWRQRDHLRARRCRALFALLPDDPAQRRLLEQAQIRFAESEAGLVLVGDAAAECARLFAAPCEPLLPGGALPRENPLARQILAAVIDQVLPPPESGAPYCGCLLPAAARSGAETGQANLLIQLIRLRGYRPLPLHPGQALVLAELAAHGFTGLGLALGAASCEWTLAFQGNPVAAGSIPRGGDWLIEQGAEQLGCYLFDAHGRRRLDLPGMTARLAARTDALGPTVGTTHDDAVLHHLMQQLGRHLVEKIGQQLAAQSGLPQPKDGWPVVLAGGLTHLPGFAEIIERQLHTRGLPCVIRDVRIATPSAFTIARGALIHAELEGTVRRAVA